ncbi:MAG: NADPH dehydrogenase, partial [Methylocystaceae bacterium]
YVTRAIGGTGLIIVEATAIAPNGRISDHDLGIWDDQHIAGLHKIVTPCQGYGCKVAIQLNHAGRKSEAQGDRIFAPSPLRFSDKLRMPVELTSDGIQEIIGWFQKAAQRADAAGFDALEIHGAHGYLINQFLSPLTNHRPDAYGGSIKNRVRFLKEIILAIKEVWPPEKPILLRVSATDYHKDGIDVWQMVAIIKEIADLVDMVHVSSGGLIPVGMEVYPGYQVELAATIKRECNIPTIAVGLITNEEMVEGILGNQWADLIALGRELLRNPYWVLQIAHRYKVPIDYPLPYERAF